MGGLGGTEVNISGSGSGINGKASNGGELLREFLSDSQNTQKYSNSFGSKGSKSKNSSKYSHLKRSNSSSGRVGEVKRSQQNQPINFYQEPYESYNNDELDQFDSCEIVP